MKVGTVTHCFLKTIRQISICVERTFHRNGEAWPKRRVGHDDVDILGLQPTEYGTFTRAPESGIVVKEITMLGRLHSKWWPRSDFVWAKASLNHQSARNVPMQWTNVFASLRS